ncbi:LAC10 [Linum perenne]
MAYSCLHFLIFVVCFLPDFMDYTVRRYNLNIRTGWADGPAYITQCPIQPGQNYVYNFTVTGQRGTLLWHAHILWLRATVHGGIVILPKRGVPYPFPSPHKELVVNLDTEVVINEAMKSELAPNVSDAHIINGHSGPVSNCASQGGFTLPVKAGNTYMLRLINAAVNEELFFKIVGHKLTAVEVDATYIPSTLPFPSDLHSSTLNPSPAAAYSKPSKPLLFILACGGLKSQGNFPLVVLMEVKRKAGSAEGRHARRRLRKERKGLPSSLLFPSLLISLLPFYSGSAGDHGRQE